MKPVKPKRSIYLRTFACLLSIWLILMLGFSAYLLHVERIAAKNAFDKDINTVYSGLNSSIRENEYRLQHTLNSLNNQQFSTKSFDFAVYSGDYDLICDFSNTWVCEYSVPAGEGIWKPTYRFLYPEKWFSAEELKQIVYYLNFTSDSKKIRDLDSYSVQLKGYVEGTEFIPEKVYVIEMYITSVDDLGNVSSGGTSSVDCAPTFDTGYKNTSGLPSIEFVHISGGFRNYDVNAKKSKPHAAVTDQEKLKSAITDCVQDINNGVEIRTEAIGFFTGQFYMVLPYNDSLNFISGTNPKIGWIAFSGECNYLSNIFPLMLAVWLMCLGVFSGAAWILSSQTWKTYQRREELEQQRRDTTNAIAHDLKTPLAVISGYAENLVSNVHTEKREHYATRILENARRMDQIVQEMLGLSRLESGTQKISLEELSLNEVTEAVTGAYADIFAEQNITCSIIGDASIKADKTLISRAINNFVSNAVTNTSQDGAIEILITDHRWSIMNTGNQIPEEQLKAIWQAYFKTDSARSNSNGSGLGLSIVKSIIELHGFTCGVENVELGVLFWFEY